MFLIDNMNYNFLCAFSIHNLSFGLGSGLFCGLGKRNRYQKKKSQIIDYRLGCTDFFLFNYHYSQN